MLNICIITVFPYVPISSFCSTIMKALCVQVGILLLIMQGFAIEEKVVCVMSETSKTTPCNCQGYIDWSTITSTSSLYFTSYTKICFPFDTFKLDTELFISNATNISLIGVDPDSPTSIKCFNNYYSFLHICNATFVKIQNFELEDCGANVQQYTKVQGAYTALLLHNVRSVNIFNVNFKNSYDHSIIGINVMDSSVLQQVSIFYVKDNISTDKKKIGGIILMYSDETVNYSSYNNSQNILIEQCQLNYTFNKQLGIVQNFKQHNIAFESQALRLDFNQQKYSVKVKIMKSSITNVAAHNGPLILISYNSSNTNNVTFFNSSVSNNNISGYSLIRLTIDMGRCKFCEPVTIFESKHCTLSHNIAQSIYFITPSSHSLLHQNAMIHIDATSSLFAHNHVTENFWGIQYETTPAYSPIINILIKQCNFTFNSDFSIEFYKDGSVTLIDNLFAHNEVKAKESKAMIKCSKTMILNFEGYNEFSFNIANRIIQLNNYIILMEHAVINITHNTVYEVIEDETSALIYFNDSSNSHLCMFQFCSPVPKSLQKFLCKNPASTFTIFFKGNNNYNSLIYGTQLNSCFWLKDTVNFGNLTTGDVMASVLHFHNKTGEEVVHRNTSTLCYCDSTTYGDCIKDHFKVIFPGQKIPINLKQIPSHSKTSIYSVAQSLDQQLYDIEQCTVIPYPMNLLQSIGNSCTSLNYTANLKPATSNYTMDYTAHSKSHPISRCHISFKTTYPDDSLYIYYIDINETCPLGFNLSDGSCECDARLTAAIPSIQCDISTQTISHFSKGWIGVSAEDKILYVEVCAPSVCKLEPTSVHLNSSDIQCNYNRGGIACGQCPPGLSAVFGSLRCKRCSNQWLFLIPAFLLAGFLLILLLFALKLTVVDGKINGFILYINVIIVNIHGLISSSSSVAKMISIMNLNLGIETCFYHDMTEYAKTWLQFAFPFYLLFIVAMLVFASRYSSSVERLTRRRVIPVIATIFLLSYGKLLLITAKVLYSYTTLYNLSDNTKTVVWMWDTTITLFSIKILFLFIASLLLVLIVLLPLTFFLLFTKIPLRVRFLAKYLKPYLDVLQAPFKDNYRHFPGLELSIRWISFAIGSIFLTTAHERLALDNFLCVFALLYVCTFKPFKSLANTVLYISYMINIECVIILQIYSNLYIGATYYIVIFHTLVFIAFAEFAATILYYLYINQLQKIRKIKFIVERISNKWLKYYGKFKVNHIPSNMEPVGEYEHLQDELLSIDPTY